MKEEPSTCNGEEPCYVVEMRTLLTQPEATGLNDHTDRPFIAGPEWARVPTHEHPVIGLKSRWLSAEAKSQQYLSYEAAMAIAYWALDLCQHGVLVRVVRYKHTYTHKFERVGEGPVVESEHKAKPRDWTVDKETP